MINKTSDVKSGLILKMIKVLEQQLDCYPKAGQKLPEMKIINEYAELWDDFRFKRQRDMQFNDRKTKRFHDFKNLKQVHIDYIEKLIKGETWQPLTIKQKLLRFNNHFIINRPSLQISKYTLWYVQNRVLNYT